MKLSSSLLLISLLVILGCDQVKSSMENATLSTDIANATQVQAAADPDSLAYCLADENLGVGGYDVVNYFTNQSAIKGNANFTALYDGVVYRFVSQSNKEIFEDNPDRYIPQYGGWCSMTLAMGAATTPKYDNFRIIDDKLYLFERTLSVNGQTLWIQDHEENKKTAQQNYIDYIDDGVISTQ